MSFLLEFGRGRRGARPLLDYRARARCRLPRQWRAGGNQPRAAEQSRSFQRRPERRRSSALRALIAESRIALPDTLPPMAAGIFGYLGYDTVRLIEDTLSAPGPDPLGIPDGILIRPNLVDRLRCREGHHHRRDAGAAAAGVTADVALARAAERLSAIVDALDRPLDKSAQRD